MIVFLCKNEWKCFFNCGWDASRGRRLPPAQITPGVSIGVSLWLFEGWVYNKDVSEKSNKNRFRILSSDYKSVRTCSFFFFVIRMKLFTLVSNSLTLDTHVHNGIFLKKWQQNVQRTNLNNICLASQTVCVKYICMYIHTNPYLVYTHFHTTKTRSSKR